MARRERMGAKRSTTLAQDVRQVVRELAPGDLGGEPKGRLTGRGGFRRPPPRHTIQCEKVLCRLGQPENEARRLVRRISEARGSYEWLSEAALLSSLDAEHRSVAGSLES
jgi:hypothetical protein